MKKQFSLVFTVLLLLTGFCHVQAQSAASITPSVLNVAGGAYDNPSIYTHFEWSFGELTVVDTYNGTNNTIITNGLLQPCTDIVTKSPDIPSFTKNEYRIFPNVTQGPFELDFFLNITGTMQLQLTDAMGRILEKRKFEYHCCDRIERYDISRYANGIYFINAVFTPGPNNTPDEFSTSRKSTFRVVKAGK